MIAAIDLPAGVVLDEPEANAFLYAAIHEHLVDDDPIIGDGFVGRILRTTPTPQLLDRAFEQTVIGGTVWLPFPIPTDWRGELFENGRVLGTPWEKSKGEVFDTIDPRVILKMLHSRGKVLSPSEFDQILDRLSRAVTHWNALTGDSLMQFRVRQMVGQMFDRATPSETLLRAADELSTASGEAEPISRCIDTYTRIIATSFERGALSSIPFSGDPGPLLEISSGLRDIDERMIIANFVCQELRTTPRGHTLRQTLALAQTQEAAALREQLAEWADCVRCGDARIDIVKREIEYAQAELSTAEMWTDVEHFCTVVAMAAPLLHAVNPMLADIFGATMTVGGVISAGAAADLKRRNRWAMLGSAKTHTPMPISEKTNYDNTLARKSG